MKKKNDYQNDKSKQFKGARIKHLTIHFNKN